ALRTGPPMSTLGQKRTFPGVCVMSALPPKADIGRVSWNVCFVPKADIRGSVDYVIGTCMQCRRNGYLQSLCGIEINHQLKCRWLHDGKISRFVALKNAAGVDPDLAPRRGEARSIAGNATGDDKLTKRVDGRHP